MKVSLNVGWLSENDLLTKALSVNGEIIVPGSANKTGIDILEKGGRVFNLLWEYDLQFTVAQLLELGFESGDFQYCSYCKKLLVDCAAERRDIVEHNASA